MMTLAAETIRYVAFEDEGEGANVLSLWQNAFRVLPESYQQPKGSVGGSVATGKVGKYRGNLISQPGRVDFVLSAIPQESEPAMLQGIGDISAAFEIGASAFRRSIRSMRPNRLAIVLDLFQEVKSNEESIDLLTRELPFILAPNGAIDVSYQVNVRKSLGSVTGVEVNRHCKWTTGSKERLEISVGSNGVPATRLLAQIPVYMVVYDINTIARAGVFSLEQKTKVMKEMQVEAMLLLEKGYRSFA